MIGPKVSRSSRNVPLVARERFHEAILPRRAALERVHVRADAREVDVTATRAATRWSILWIPRKWILRKVSCFGFRSCLPFEKLARNWRCKENHRGAQRKFLSSPKMPKYFCDYCDTYLTHDSPSVRKSHLEGWRHKAAVKAYYSQFEQNAMQDLIEQKIRMHELSGASRASSIKPLCRSCSLGPSLSFAVG